MLFVVCWPPQVAAMTERGQLATESQRGDVDLLVGRLEELKVEEEQSFKDENMVRSSFAEMSSCWSSCANPW